MSLFNRHQKPVQNGNADQAAMAMMVINAIREGVVIVNEQGIIQFINPAAAVMTNVTADNAVGLDFGLVLKLEAKDGRELTDAENPLLAAIRSGQPLADYIGLLLGQGVDKRTPVAISVLVVDGGARIITLRNVAKELEEEGAQMEFISTASHEMRTPVASIEGYLALALNPQTAAIDERARGYLNAAHSASQHLGQLFRDLLDVTKFDDGKGRARMVPVEMVGLAKQIADGYLEKATAAKLKYQFGVPGDGVAMARMVPQVVYGFVDVEYMREILGNLIENAVKYTPEGGSVYVNVRGDGDRILINVTDTGTGIAADDLQHIFQKFYRADNSQTRTVGGTGLGLYLVKQRAEAMGGKVWAESSFGEGSTFYVSLPRLTGEEYEKRMIAYQQNLNNVNGGIK